jgi:serine protease AprX
MNTRLITSLAVAALVAGLAMTPASANARHALPAPNADVDGDRIFENLSARLESLAAEDRLSVVVRLNGDLTRERIDAVERDVGRFELTRSLPIVDGFTATVTKAQAGALARLPGVASVEENGVVRALNDGAQESFGVTKARTDLPGLDGDTDGDPGSYSRRDLVVAVVDSGIDATHPQLDDGKVLAFVDCSHHATIPDPSTCFARDAFDDNDHGTHIAGIIAGDGEGDERYKGVAPGAALVGVKVLRADNTGTLGAIVSGIQWVVQNRHRYGIEAINISLAGNRCSDGTDVLSDAAEAAIAAGLVVVAGAGNLGPAACTVDGPAAAPNVIAVGAMADTGMPRSGEQDVTRGFYLARFSSRGPTLDGRIKPDIVAPGIGITSANADNANNGVDPYVTFLGTSMASPFVLGVALLMLEANPDLSHAQIKSILMSTAVDWGLGGNLHEPGSSGVDVDYGAGRLDAFAAIKAAGAQLGTGPTAPAHTVLSGTLVAAGSAQHSVTVTDASVPLAGTLIMPRWADVDDPDFNLALRDPDGAVIGTSVRQERQETVAVRITRTGTYTFEVSSVAGSGPYVLDVSGGSRVTESPVATAPGAPRNVVAVAGNARATVSWAAPDSDGGSPITNYVVTPYLGTSAQAPTTVGDSTEAVIRGLENGSTYTFTVRARNAVGDGPESAASNAVTPQRGRRP